MEDERVDLELAAIWAVLLAHRLDEDDSDVSPFYGLVVVSPWTPGKVARIGPAAKP